MDCESYDSGNPTEDYDHSYPVGMIKELDVSSAMKIKIVQGPKTILRAKGFEDKTDMVVRDMNGKLEIYMKNSFFIGSHPEVEVILITPSLKKY